MPTIQFIPGYDMHLLRGQSLQVSNGGDSSLTSLLRIDGIDALTYINTPANAPYSYRFSYSFNLAGAANFGINITNPSPTTPRSPDCKITLSANEPASAQNRIRNFYLFAELTDTTTNRVISQTALRIHIHNRIEEIWMTPNPLTVSMGYSAQPSLRARFDDDVVAELWNIPITNPGNRVAYNIAPRVVIKWGPDDVIGPDSGWIASNKPVGSYSMTAEATFNNVTKNTSAELRISSYLSGNTPLHAEIVSISSSPGFSKLNEVPNILFIPDGLVAEEQTDFNKIVDNYVSQLVNNKITLPFGNLRGSINYWKLFIPSREKGTTHRGEFIVKQNGTKLSGVLVPFCINPAGIPVEKWSLAHLLHQVGLPIRAESDPTNATVLTGLLAKWAATTLLTTGQLTWFRDHPALVHTWQALADRRLPEARDTVLGITISDFTKAVDDGDTNLISLEVNRVFRTSLDQLFAHLKDATGQLIGPVFLSDFALQQGKDMTNIVILSASGRGRSQNTFRGILTKIGNIDINEAVSLIPQTGLKVFVEPLKMPATLSLMTKSTITHEICHSFGLGDEYGNAIPAFAGKPTDDPAVQNLAYVNFDQRKLEILDTFSNVQARIDLLAASGLDTSQIKWRYHRIATCRIVTGVKLLNATQVELTLRSGQPGRFKINDRVFLRKRKKSQRAYFIFSKPATGDPAKIATVLSPDPLPKTFQREGMVTQIIDDERLTIFFETKDHGEQNIELVVEKGQTASLTSGQEITIQEETRSGPIYTIFRTPSTPAGSPDHIEKALSPELTVASPPPNDDKLILTIPANASLSAYLQTVTDKEEMLVYKPVYLPADQRTDLYPYAELIAKPVLNHLIAHPNPFNANKQNREFIHATTFTRIPGKLVPCCSRREKEIIGLYAGGNGYHGGIYHPAATCMMRFKAENEKYVELCAVCRYTLINLIDPTKFAAFDSNYMDRKIYID